jgi:mannose-1-phosphate guanylyltransferase / mannose-6-phosphate isomerase
MLRSVKPNTKKKMITPVILCGGSGTRLWPLSRKGYPKQFARLLGERSLFAGSAARVVGEGFAAPVIVTGSDFRFVVTEQLAAEGLDPGAILIEPEGRNTAPAVLAAALHLAATDPDALILIAPSDHAIADPSAFRTAVLSGVAAARAGQIVTFGIKPSPSMPFLMSVTLQPQNIATHQQPRIRHVVNDVVMHVP